MKLLRSRGKGREEHAAFYSKNHSMSIYSRVLLTIHLNLLCSLTVLLRHHRAFVEIRCLPQMHAVGLASVLHEDDSIGQRVFGQESRRSMSPL